MCVCVCERECELGGWAADGQHGLVPVWGLDQCRVIIAEPPLCFRDPSSVGCDL